MMIAAQPELNVPMTPTTSSSFAYRPALVEHFAESHLPAAAVASLHSWSPTFRSPAFHSFCSMTCSIALFICTVCVRDEPCSGRSDTISTSGSASPFLRSPHEDDGNVSTPPLLGVAEVSLPPVLGLLSSPHPAAVSASAPTTSARSANQMDFFLTCLLLLG